MKETRFLRRIRRYTLLYVEDDPDLRASIGEFLRRFTPHLLEAASAEEAAALYEAHTPRIVLLDINLPGMSGIDLCASIRHRDKKTRFIMTTAYTDEVFLLKAVELGLTRYLVKPMTSDDLLAALRKAIEELETIDPATKRIDLGRGIGYDPSEKCLVTAEGAVPLRRKELELLEFFLARRGEVIPYEQFEHGVWRGRVMTPDAIRSQIRNLRKKSDAALIENISGIGYRFRREDDDDLA